jgi:hypothetical protein
MAETKGKVTSKPKARKSVKVETGPIDAEATIELEGFSHEETVRLMEARRKVAAGEINEITPEHRKLLFVQWLIEHEQLRS